MHKICAVLYLSTSLMFAVHCYRNPSLGIDLLSYIGNVALTDSKDPVVVHQMVYHERLPPHLLGIDADDVQAQLLRKRAADAFYFTTYLPYFSVKPLYVIALEAAHRAGFGLISSSRVISAASKTHPSA